MADAVNVLNSQWNQLGGLAPKSAHKEHAASAVHYENALRDIGLFRDL